MAKDCKAVDYARAHEVWNTLQMRNMRDYTIFYLCSDIMILSDVFNCFRELTLQDYSLDPARFYTAGSLGMRIDLTQFSVKHINNNCTSFNLHTFLQKHV